MRRLRFRPRWINFVRRIGLTRRGRLDTDARPSPGAQGTDRETASGPLSDSRSRSQFEGDNRTLMHHWGRFEPSSMAPELSPTVFQQAQIRQLFLEMIRRWLPQRSFHFLEEESDELLAGEEQ